MTLFCWCHRDWRRCVLWHWDWPGKFVVSGRKGPGLLMTLSGPERDWGKQRVTGRKRMRTGDRRKVRREKRKGGGWEEGRRHGIWRLLGWSQQAVLHRQFPTLPVSVLGGVEATSSARGLSRSELFSPRQTHLYAVWLASERRRGEDKREKLEIYGRGLGGERMSWRD